MRFSYKYPMLVLLLLASCCCAIAQANSTKDKSDRRWREYVYADYGFAITVPEAPKETAVSNGTQYRLYWNEDWDKGVVVNLTATRDFTDCAAWLTWARDTFDNPGTETLSKVVTINGNPSIEASVPQMNSLQAGYERHQCLNNKLYNFEARWPKGQSKPEIVDRVLKSFRLLTTEAKQ